MKKLLVLLFALVLVVALAACSTPDETTLDTTLKTDMTTPVVTTPVVTTPTVTTPVTSTQAPDTDEPKLPGIDILNGDFENMAITPNWQGADACALEDHHSALNFNVALVIHMQYCESSIYEELILTTDSEASNQTNWELNESYRWVVTIDGQDIEIERFSILNDGDSGYVRMDLGSDWKYSEEVDNAGYHEYDIWLKIYDKTADNTIAFWAYLTDPDWNGPYMFKTPEPILMVDDANRDPSHVALPAEDAQPLGGPAGLSSETYDFLFDGDVRSKLCTRDITESIIFKYDSSIHLVSYSLVNANDDEKYPERTPLVWKLYGSHDGSQWDLIDSQELTETDNTNYQERNFKLSEEAEYSYFKFEPIISGEMYQLSEIIMYTSADYIG